MAGNAQYHIFYHKTGQFQHNHPFILKVFGTSRDREWVYKDMDPLSSELRVELQEFMLQTLDMVAEAMAPGIRADLEAITKVVEGFLARWNGLRVATG